MVLMLPCWRSAATLRAALKRRLTADISSRFLTRVGRTGSLPSFTFECAPRKRKAECEDRKAKTQKMLSLSFDSPILIKLASFSSKPFVSLPTHPPLPPLPPFSGKRPHPPSPPALLFPLFPVPPSCSIFRSSLDFSVQQGTHTFAVPRPASDCGSPGQRRVFEFRACWVAPEFTFVRGGAQLCGSY